MEMRNQHLWDGPDEKETEFAWRATKFAGRWKIHRIDDVGRGPEWVEIKSPHSSILEQLRGVLFRKYQRRRVPYEDVTHIERLRDDALSHENPE